MPEHLMSTVKRLHEELGGNEVASLFEGLGIMSIRTGAPIPKPKNGQAQKDILILVAHPDDAEIMYGAQALHEMVENRSIMHYFVLFPGTAGGDDRGFTQLGAPILRAVELIAAARKLGIPWVHFFCGPEVNEEGFPENFGLREWLGSLALKNSEDAAFLLGLALARTFVADEVWGHVANSAIDWHRDHFFAALMADAYAAFGQWVAYMHCLVDTRKRVPAGVLRVFGVVWENSEKLAQTLKTVYYRHTKTGRLTPLASLILESLDT
ncbi:PIG-L family deacetylase, partial [Candidatus Woesebacteria bacterium]|nr:PIG-L family deacetylase [Candidatus Woesebacteria bacterium]